MIFLLEKFIFLVLIFSIPFQKRFFLFGPSPEGERFFEWSSGFLYFTDFLVIALLAFWFTDFLRQENFHRNVCLRVGPPLFLAVFLGLALLSSTQADLVGVAAYRFVKLAEFIFLFFYTVIYVGRRMSRIRQILWTFVASGVSQSFIAILQFAKQSSLGLEIFHESTLAIGVKGVAEISAGGIEFIRAYGTFPSPNVLAGFLGLCLLFLFYLYFMVGSKNTIIETFASPASSLIQSSARSSDYKSDTMPARLRVFCNSILRPPSIIYFPILLVLIFGFNLTFSRGVSIFFVFTGILFFAGIFLFEKLKHYRKQAAQLAGLVIASWLLIIAALWPEASFRFLESSVREPAIQERLFFNDVGVDIVRQDYTQLLFGVGMGNFVHNYRQFLPGLAPHLYQPVHNIFILIASEIGILGLIAFLLFLTFLIGRAIKVFLKFLNCKDMQKNHDSINFVYVFGLLLATFFLFLIAMYDHYFWTLQQGSLMFWIALGLMASKIKAPPNA